MPAPPPGAPADQDDGDRTGRTPHPTEPAEGERFDSLPKGADAAVDRRRRPA